jgi:hypothetical protein
MPDNERSSSILPEQILERYLLGELSARERRRLERILRRDETAAARLAALKRSDAEILAAYPPGEMAEKIRARAASQPGLSGSARREQDARGRRGFRLPSFAMPLAAAALILIAILPLRTAFSSRDETRAKGLESRLEVYRQRENGDERLRDGAPAAAGDLLQVAYVAAEAGYGLIVSIDGRGTVTGHFPRQAPAGAPAPALKQGGEIALPFAYQLDDAPGFERFFLVTSADPFDVEPVLRAAAALAADPEAARRQPLALPAGLEQASLLIIKEETP